MLLAVSVNASHALFKTRWVPRHVVVHHKPTELEIDPFAPSSGANQDTRTIGPTKAFLGCDLGVFLFLVFVGKLNFESVPTGPLFRQQLKI